MHLDNEALHQTLQLTAIVYCTQVKCLFGNLPTFLGFVAVKEFIFLPFEQLAGDTKVS